VSPSRVEWFEKRFNRSTVDVVVIEGQPFILVTSMALHGDGCRFCYEAERELDEIAKELNCSKLDTCEKNASRVPVVTTSGWFWEYTVNSFSWRNGNRPTFLMATISEDDVMMMYVLVGTCHLPNESTVINLYCITAIITVIWILRSLLVARYPGMLRTLRSQPSSSKLIKSG
ncbi:hypothetical protein OSTOST_23848, partial [Ostertagia ostertagi]